MKKMIIMIIAVVMMFSIFCGCETHNYTKVTVDHLDGTVDVYESIDGELIDHYMIIKD